MMKLSRRINQQELQQNKKYELPVLLSGTCNGTYFVENLHETGVFDGILVQVPVLVPGSRKACTKRFKGL
jgi:hypothetical protein